MKKFGVKEVVATGIGAAIVFVLARFVSIPTPLPDTSLSTHTAVIALFSILYGPVVGGLAGFIGQLLVDVTAGWGIWWSWIFPAGIYGIILGFGCKGIDLSSGKFTKKDIARLAVVSLIGCAVCWGLVAPVCDIIFYGEPAAKVFAQGLFIGISGFVSTVVIGSILCFAYAKTIPAAGSLSKED